jgi:hypothetical protein
VTSGTNGADRSRVVAVVVVALVAAVVAAGGSVAAAAQDDTATTTSENVSASVDDAKEVNARVSALQGLVDSTAVQYLGGIGIGLGVGLCVGGVVMYELQSRRIEETFE